MNVLGYFASGALLTAGAAAPASASFCGDLIRVIESGRSAFVDLRGSRANEIMWQGRLLPDGAARCEILVNYPSDSSYTCLLAVGRSSEIPRLHSMMRRFEQQISACIVANDRLTFRDIGRRRYRYNTSNVIFDYDVDDTSIEWPDRLHSRNADVELHIQYDTADRYALKLRVEGKGLDRIRYRD